MLKIKNHWIYVIKITLCFIFFSTTYKANANDVNTKNHSGIHGFKISTYNDLTSVTISLDKKSDVYIKLLNEPYRIILDFKETIKIRNNSLNKSAIQSDLIQKIRLGYPNNSFTRLVFELSESAIVSSLIYNQDKNNSEFVKLQLEISKTSRTSFGIAKHVLSKNKGKFLDLNYNYENKTDFKNELINLPKMRMINLPKMRQKKIRDNKKSITLFESKKYKDIKNNEVILNKTDYFTVFIDAGHGGKDPGAVGSLGTLEKNITLQVALEIANSLKKRKNIIPILSRKNDIYLPLRQRIKLAKINKADVFISIHADASTNKNAKGISVFSLSDKASDNEAKKIAERENSVDTILGGMTSYKDPIVIGNLIKMFQRQAMNDSAILVREILTYLDNAEFLVDRGHRFAGFAVLKSPDIPSALIEVGFISNLKEEKKLLNKKYIRKLSESLSFAIEKYLKK